MIQRNKEYIGSIEIHIFAFIAMTSKIKVMGKVGRNAVFIIDNPPHLLKVHTLSPLTITEMCGDRRWMVSQPATNPKAIR